VIAVASDVLAVDAIDVGDRHRKDFGDIESLAESIDKVGLLSPIVVDSSDRLVAGHRRLLAVELLGWSSVPVRRVEQIADAVTALIAERDENTCRKDFTPSEAVALGVALEELERPKAEERRKQAPGEPRGTRAADVCGGESPQQTKGKTRDIVAPAVGMKPSRYAHAKTVVNAQDDPDPYVAEVAKEAVEEMDRTDNVETAYRKVRAARSATKGDSTTDRIERAKVNNPLAPASGSGKSRAEVDAKIATYQRMAAEGHTSRQIGEAIGVKGIAQFCKNHGLDAPPADAVVGKPRRHDTNRILSEMVYGLEAYAMSIDLIDVADIDADQIDEWAISIKKSVRSISHFLKEITHVEE
jgi:ParB-like chromosome segregation protein Spo0J